MERKLVTAKSHFIAFGGSLWQLIFCWISPFLVVPILNVAACKYVGPQEFENGGKCVQDGAKAAA